MGQQPGAGQHLRLRCFSLVHPRRAHDTIADTFARIPVRVQIREDTDLSSVPSSPTNASASQGLCRPSATSFV